MNIDISAPTYDQYLRLYKPYSMLILLNIELL